MDERKVQTSSVGPTKTVWDYDEELIKAGFRRFHTKQDADYFGVWIHLADRAFVTFCEGDITTVICYNHMAFCKEIGDQDEYYGGQVWGLDVRGPEDKGYRPSMDEVIEAQLTGPWKDRLHQ